MYTTKTLTIANAGTTSGADSFMETNGIVYLTAIRCPAALTSTVFRLERELSPDSGTYGPMRAPATGADYPYTFSANGIIPLDGDTIKACKGMKIRIVTASAEGAERVFTLEYEKL